DGRGEPRAAGRDGRLPGRGRRVRGDRDRVEPGHGAGVGRDHLLGPGGGRVRRPPVDGGRGVRRGAVGSAGRAVPAGDGGDVGGGDVRDAGGIAGGGVQGERAGCGRAEEDGVAGLVPVLVSGAADLGRGRVDDRRAERRDLRVGRRRRPGRGEVADVVGAL